MSKIIRELQCGEELRALGEPAERFCRDVTKGICDYGILCVKLSRGIRC
jgi:hypothetical protein